VEQTRACLTATYRAYNISVTDSVENTVLLIGCNYCLVIARCSPLLRAQPSARTEQRKHFLVVWVPLPSSDRLL
jgi:hypothetical protein